MRKIDPSKVMITEFTNANTIKIDISKFLDIRISINIAVDKVYDVLKTSRIDLSPMGFKFSYLEPKLYWYANLVDSIYNKFIFDKGIKYNSLLLNAFDNYAVLEYDNGNIERLPIKFSDSEMDVLTGVYSYMNRYYNYQLNDEEREMMTFEQLSTLIVVTMLEVNIEKEKSTINLFLKLKNRFLNKMIKRRYLRYDK